MFLNHNVFDIWLTLGNKCNCNCTYCSQHDLTTSCIANKINSDIYSFFEKISEDNLRNHFRKPRILFYGGEPLIYWANIVEIKEKLKDSYNYRIITNGKLLNDEYIDYINSNNVQVQVSWDGRNSLKTRRYDPFLEKKDLIFKIKRLSIHPVFTAYSPMRQTLDDCNILDKEYCEVQGHHIEFGANYICPYGDQKDGVFDLNLNRLSEDMRYLSDRYFNDVDIGYPAWRFLRRYERQYAIYLLDKGKMNFRNRHCADGLCVLNMDLQGNLYSCHNESVPIGTIYDEFVVYLAALMEKDFSDKHIEMCKDCDVLSMCMGGCRAMQFDKTYCAIHKAAFRPFIKNISKQITSGFRLHMDRE